MRTLGLTSLKSLSNICQSRTVVSFGLELFIGKDKLLLNSDTFSFSFNRKEDMS